MSNTRTIVLSRPTRLRKNCMDLSLTPSTYLEAGTVIEILDNPFFGAYYKDSNGWTSNKWFKRKDTGDFIWEGGVSFSDQLPVELQFRNRDKIWLEHLLSGGGRGASISIIDKQFNLRHPNLKHLNRVGFKFRHKNTMSQGNDEVYDSADGHGTACLSFLAGKALSETEKVMGLLPNADIYLHNIADDLNVAQLSYLKNALATAIEKRVHTIVLSIGYIPSQPDYEKAKEVLEPLLKQAKENEITVICAANKDIDDLITIRNYPAISDYTIAVGSISTDLIDLYKDKVSDRVEYFFPRIENILSCNHSFTHSRFNKQKFIKVQMDSSYTTMIFAGIFTLLKTKYSIDKARQLLEEVAFPLSELPTNNSFHNQLPIILNQRNNEEQIRT